MGMDSGEIVARVQSRRCMLQYSLPIFSRLHQKPCWLCKVLLHNALSDAGVALAIAEPGSVQHEIGGGVSGRVSGHSIALGSLAWVLKHAQQGVSEVPEQAEAASSSTHSQTEVGHSGTAF